MTCTKEGGFTGIEAAIVLIAFVMVAAVFAYAILGSGIFVTQKAQTTTYQSLKEGSAVIYPEGSMYGALSSDGHLDDLQFTLAIPETGLDQDLEGMIIIYTHSYPGGTIQLPRTYTYGGSTASATTFGVEGGVRVMAAGEKRKFELQSVGGPTSGGTFSLEIKPKIGASTYESRWLTTGYTGGVII